MAQLSTLRRTPQQARSRETVLTILVAAARVLQQHGFKRLSTNRVAKVAGVSVGSLYQYFSGKEDLLSQLAERRVEVLTVEHQTRAHRADSAEEVFAVAADVAVEAASLEHDLERLVPGFVPQPLNTCQVLLGCCLETGRGEFRADKLELASTLGASAIVRAMSSAPDEWSQSEALRKELRATFARHLLARAHDSGIRSSVPLAHTA
ncbi:MAG: TetR/AcrR family transcriptional regulator [Polyangiaceae bacterium]|nr:TetR/AcrR family transcriptional regulator [Polyangiaceae bacterium]MCB9607023.1 TetR/AcrR family transcriptional regulator [Polyangiaceae bacterium]